MTVPAASAHYVLKVPRVCQPWHRLCHTHGMLCCLYCQLYCRGAAAASYHMDHVLFKSCVSNEAMCLINPLQKFVCTQTRKPGPAHRRLVRARVAS